MSIFVCIRTSAHNAVPSPFRLFLPVHFGVFLLDAHQRRPYTEIGRERFGISVGRPLF